MSREAHVRFWERVGVRFPRATRCPLYRQSQIYARSGLELDRSTLAGWVGKAAFHLRPVYDRLKAALKTSSNLGLDETTVRVLDPGRSKTKTGYLWTMARDERSWSGADSPGVAYEYAPGRSGKHGEKLLEGFRGTVQVDGYAGHNRLGRPERPGGALTLAACWVHARAGPRDGVRQQRLADREGRTGPHRAALCHREEDPGPAAGDAPVRPLDRAPRRW